MMIQLCFQIKDAEHNANVIEKLKEVKTKLGADDKVVSCHLPKHIVEAKGWPTEIVDALEQIFGNQYECLVEADTFEAAMSNMLTYRSEAAKVADKIFIVGEQSVANIALEIELFTNKQIQFF